VVAGTLTLGAHVARGFDVPNYSGSVVCQPAEWVKVRNIQEIQAVVKKARDSGRGVTAVSIKAPRSYSQVICGDKAGTMVNVESLNKFISIDVKGLTATVEPGVLLGDLQDVLHREGLAFPVTPDYNGVTVAGAMGTGAHHSSLQIPSAVGDWVQEIKLVDGTGELRTISGDDLDAFRVHLGLMGILVEVKLRVVPQFKLRHGFDKYDDRILEFRGAGLVRQHDYAKIHWFPKQGKFIVDHLTKVPNSTSGQSYSTFWTSAPDLPVFKDLPIRILNSSKAVQAAAEALRVKTWGGMFKAIDSPPSNPVGYSHQMMAGTCLPGSCSWEKGIKTRTVEVAFPLTSFPSWVRDVRQIIEQRPAYFPVLGIYLRFSQASKAYLGQAFGEETVMFEIHIPETSTPALEPSSEVYDEILQMTLGKYNGRPHWGKNSQPYFRGLGTKQYPMFDQFESIRRTVDPEGMFVTPFWKDIDSPFERAGLPECGVNRSCICRVDADCGFRGRCEPGIFYEEARVCLKD
jgi:FAD-dependent oxidoreductase